MIAFVVIWLTAYFKDWIRLHEEIGGRWHVYLWNLFKLKKYRRTNRRGRLDLHDVFEADLMNIGFVPFKEEYEYANPKKIKSENLFIYGTNTGEKTTIQVNFKRQPLTKALNPFEAPKDQVSVSFKLGDGQGNVYSMEEKSVVEFSSTEYRASGFAFEAFEGNRIGRIKFRGYLKRNDESKLVYVQIRFLCLSFSKTFDHQRLFDAGLMAKELSKGFVGSIEDLLENKIEQFCQIKGTFKVEENEEMELFFLGTVGRRFMKPNVNCVNKTKVVKLCGFDKEGFGFQVGLVSHGVTKYRYGFMSKLGEPFKVLEYWSLSDECIERLPTLTSLIDSYEFHLKFAGDKMDYKVVVRRFDGEVKLVEVNGVEGMGFVVEEDFDEMELRRERRIDEESSVDLGKKLVVALDEDCAKVTDLTGGKGASLAQLKQLSINAEWTVPNAVVVTSSAYRVMTEAINDFDDKLETLERQVIKRDNVQKNCEGFVKWFAGKELNEKIKDLLKKKMENEFGADWETMLFAVRSSAANEDSSEMSAAGQMTTYLGVSGLERVSKAVVACWASQFGFVPVEYKRGYGQSLNSPMAVVVQQMVDCSSAGVIFTANPTDGDERLLTVTSNFGLGESVVSAAAEPDTFTLSVNITANSYQTPRSINSIVKREIGKKALITRLSAQAGEGIDDGIQNEQVADGAQKQSLSDEDIIRLGNIALQIASHYGNARDLEWGIVSGQLFLFQSRPITNLDSNFTNYELMHEMDTAHMNEFEIYSRAHVGENMPGAASWLINFLFTNGVNFMKKEIRQGSSTADDWNPFRSIFGRLDNQMFLTLGTGPFLQMFMDYPDSDMAVSGVLAFFGHHITDEDVLTAFRKAPRDKVKTWRFKILMPLTLLYFLFFSHRQIPKVKKQIFNESYVDAATPLKKKPLKEKLAFLCIFMVTHYDVFDVHGPASFCSLLKTMILRKVLKSVEASDEDLESDMNLLMSHCNDVVSAEVPSMLREIAKTIQDKESFSKLNDKEALDLLQSKSSSESKASEIFSQFLTNHGHRCYRELDPMYPTWRTNPIPCVQVVKSLLNSKSPLETKKNLSVDEVLKQIKAPLPGCKRLLVKYWLLPWVRDAVGNRENTKSMLIKFQEHIRDALKQIAEDLVEHGILPEADLLFYLKLDEIWRLTRGERNPLLVMKAKQRKRLYPTMNAFKFDEFVKGFRMAPRPAKREVIQLADDSVSLSGTAVTVGAIKARVCVAETIEEAVNIQPGDILLTYSTDIGWSPYFPLISGIVTEIGGTISHGAVIAREFGIPCLIAVEDACQYFKTGDIAYLDTKTGTIVKVKE